jgi:hypothetical protein
VLESVHLLFLLLGLVLPKEVETGRPFDLASVEDDAEKEES